MTHRERIGCGTSGEDEFMPCHTCDYADDPEHCRGYWARHEYVELFGVIG